MFASWLNLAMLALESQHVMTLRMIKLASGGSVALDEAQLMVSEKMSAGHHAGERLMAGASADAIVSRYRGIVQANARRLSRQPDKMRKQVAPSSSWML